MRRRRVWRGSAAGSTKTVSERFSSRAILGMKRSSRPSASGNTASGLPPKRWSVKTSAVRKRSLVIRKPRGAAESAALDRDLELDVADADAIAVGQGCELVDGAPV